MEDGEGSPLPLVTPGPLPSRSCVVPGSPLSFPQVRHQEGESSHPQTQLPGEGPCNLNIRQPGSSPLWLFTCLEDSSIGLHFSSFLSLSQTKNNVHIK